MRTIDADAALKALRKCQTYLYDARDPELKIELSSAEAAINNLPTIQPEKTQFPKESITSDLISRQATIDAVDAIGHIATMPDGDKCIRRSAVKYTLSMLPPAQPEYRIDEWCLDCKEYDQEHHCCPRFNRVIREYLKDAQPEPSILLSWVEKYIEWLRSLDNEFANLAAAHISVMVKKWRDEQDERTD